MKFKKGDKVIWKRFIDSGGREVPLNDIDEEYQKLITERTILTITKLNRYNNTYGVDNPIMVGQYFFERELIYSKIENWRKRLR